MMYVIRVNYFILNNRLVCFLFLGKDCFPILQLPVVLYVVLKHTGILPKNFGVPIDVIVQHILSVMCMGIASDIPSHQSLTTNSLVFRILQYFHHIFWNYHLALFKALALSMFPLQLGSTTMLFHWMWFYVMVSVYCREKFS